MTCDRLELVERYRDHDAEVFRHCNSWGNPDFARSKMHLQALGGLACPEEVLRAERLPPFSSDQTSPGYVTDGFTRDQEDQVNASSYFRVISGPLEERLTACVQTLRAPVRALLGTPWRIQNIRVYSTPPKAKPSLMYGWHEDGMPDSIFKVMLYFTPMDVEHGGLEIDRDAPRLLTGPPSWLLFYNSGVTHRGVPGTTYERCACEIVISRAREFDLALHQPGLNAHYLLFP